MLVLGFSEYETQGRRLAQALSLPYSTVEVHRFPDGESRVRLPSQLPPQVILCRSLDHPNDKLIELLLTAETARESGVERLTLVAPYLCYMRQDIAFHPGEAVSQRIVGRFLAGLFDCVITIDAHLHRIDRLDQALPGIQAINLSAGPLLSEYLKQRTTPEQCLLVGPDSESAQWVEAIADSAEREFVIASKQRFGDRQVEISLPEHAYAGKQILLIDDVISTGTTLCRVATDLMDRGVASIDALVTHALYDTNAGQRMQAAGIRRICSSDSVSHPSNSLSLDQLLADAIRHCTT
jgi:ribose-phosphate pyrophosphokinase